MAGTEERQEAFFEKHIRNPGRTDIINSELSTLKERMMVDRLLDEMVTKKVIVDIEKAQITGQGEGTAIVQVQAGRFLELLKRKDGYLYIRFLMILKEHQRDLAKTLTGTYFDLLSQGDLLEERFENPPATLNKQPTSSPRAKEGGKDYQAYINKYIETEAREGILQTHYNFVVKFLQPKQILPKLVSKRVIDQDDKSEIEGDGTGFKVQKKQSEALLEMLKGMEQKKYVAFLDVLSMAQKDILTKLTGGEYINGEELKGSF